MAAASTSPLQWFAGLGVAGLGGGGGGDKPAAAANGVGAHGAHPPGQPPSSAAVSTAAGGAGAGCGDETEAGSEYDVTETVTDGGGGELPHFEEWQQRVRSPPPP